MNLFFPDLGQVVFLKSIVVTQSHRKPFGGNLPYLVRSEKGYLVRGGLAAETIKREKTGKLFNFFLMTMNLSLTRIAFTKIFQCFFCKLQMKFCGLLNYRRTKAF